MIDEFTPTTEHVREYYAVDFGADYSDPEKEQAVIESNRKAFDRWLAEHDRELVDKLLNPEPADRYETDWQDEHDYPEETP